MDKTKHRHYWSRAWWTGGPRNRQVGERCRCGAERKRFLKGAELKEHNRQQKQSNKAAKILHGPWHDIRRLLQDPVGKPRKMRLGKGKTVTIQDHEWVDCREAGDRMDRALARLQKKWPGRIHLVHVDDSHFCSADVYLITHEVPKELLADIGSRHSRWMGTSVLHIPQCNGVKPSAFFMYDGHRKSLLAGLKEVAKRRAAYPKGLFG